jgi:hypothetical protein
MELVRRHRVDPNIIYDHRLTGLGFSFHHLLLQNLTKLNRSPVTFMSNAAAFVIPLSNPHLHPPPFTLSYLIHSRPVTTLAPALFFRSKVRDVADPERISLFISALNAADVTTTAYPPPPPLPSARKKPIM